MSGLFASLKAKQAENPQQAGVNLANGDVQSTEFVNEQRPPSRIPAPPGPRKVFKPIEAQAPLEQPEPGEHDDLIGDIEDVPAAGKPRNWRGGGRKRVHKDNAARQAAYRERKANA